MASQSVELISPTSVYNRFWGGLVLAVIGFFLYNYQQQYANLGVLLALGTIKPQLSGLPAVCLLVWAILDWNSRQRLAWGFAITMALLAGVSELLVPGWIRQFVAGLIAYQRYTGNTSIFTLFFGHAGGAITSAALLLWMAYVCWRLRRESAASDGFAFALCLVLLVTVLIIPTMYPTGQVVLLPAMFWLLREAGAIWAAGRWARLSYVAVWALVSWQWVGAVAAMIATWLFPLDLVRRFWIVPVSTILLIPLALLIPFFILAPSVMRRLDSQAAV